MLANPGRTPRARLEHGCDPSGRHELLRLRSVRARGRTSWGVVAVSSLDGRREGFGGSWVCPRRCDCVRVCQDQPGAAGGCRQRFAACSRIRETQPGRGARERGRAVPARAGSHAGRSALSEEAAASLASRVARPAWDAATGPFRPAHRVSRSRRPQPPHDLRIWGSLGARLGIQLAAAPLAQSPMLLHALRGVHENRRSRACDDGRPARRPRGTPRDLPAGARQQGAVRLGRTIGVLVQSRCLYLAAAGRPVRRDASLLRFRHASTAGSPRRRAQPSPTVTVRRVYGRSLAPSNPMSGHAST